MENEKFCLVCAICAKKESDLTQLGKWLMNDSKKHNYCNQCAKNMILQTPKITLRNLLHTKKDHVVIKRRLKTANQGN